MPRVWAGSYADKSRILAALGLKRLQKKGKQPRRKGKSHQSLRKLEKAQRRNWTWAYSERNLLLKQLGFASYAEYLDSKLWRDIRKRVLRRDWDKCYGCGRTACQGHHRSYAIDVLTGKNIRPIVAICYHCHTEIEHDSKGNKISLDAANAKLEAIRNRNQHKASA